MGWCHKFLFGIDINYISLIGNICCDIVQYPLLNKQEPITVYIFKNYEPVVVADLLYPQGGGYKYIYLKIMHNICADNLAKHEIFHAIYSIHILCLYPKSMQLYITVF